ncbi:ester cyclase [candidate division KSB1 bacterium]|nr:ester cyclase [candidate division KSB1 bacterium]
MKQFTQTFMRTVLVVLIMALFIAMGCQQPDAAQKLKPIVDAYAEVWNTGNLNALDAIIDPQFVRHTSPAGTTSAVSLDSLKKVISNLRTAYPDFHVTLDEEIYVGEKAIVRWSYIATNTGAGNFPPTGKQVKSTGIDILRIKNGKIVDDWAETDNLFLMQQLGFTLTPPSVSSAK